MSVLADRRFGKMMVMAMALVLIAGLTSSGCTTLRRKFVRKSKTEDTKDRIVPVLQPEEYQPIGMSAKDDYRMQYSVLKGYFGDLWDVLGKGEGDKRERYILAQIEAKIEAMATLLKEDKQTELKQLLAKVTEGAKELDKARALRRYDILSSNLRSVEDGIRHGFTPKKVEMSFK